MIAFFPDPYPDELLYSICARYSDRMQYGNKEYTNQELFGSRGITTSVDLPSHLSYLLSVLPSGHCYTVDRLIDAHTLLPFYSPFLPFERVNRIREDMQTGNSSALHKCSGITPSSVRSPNWFRFCPLCTEEDEKQFGERYWHRLHQITGVEVCPIHNIFLENSNAPARNRRYSRNYLSAEQTIQVTVPRSLDLSNYSHQFLLKIARDVAWLLSQRNLVPGLQCLRNRYLKVLFNQGYATYNGIVHGFSLIDAFKSFYSHSLLEQLQCQLDKPSDCTWLYRLVKPYKNIKVNHPLRHLLLIQFLGHTAEEFFNLVEEFEKPSYNSNPFGEGPWPCLNPVCDQFRKPQIRECSIHFTHIQKERRNRPVGTFRCTCGFVYSRTGPDVLPEDQFLVTKVKSYGSLWEARLQNLWEDSSLSLRAIARKLGFKHTTVKSQAVRLGLRFPRPGPIAKSTQASTELLSHPRNALVTTQDTLEIYREEWLAAVNKNPGARRTFLANTFSRLYHYLRKYDAEWLEAHMPLPFVHRRVGAARQVDWESRDIELADAVKLSALRLKNISTDPVRITKTAIGQDIDKKELLHRQLHKLPKTAQVLAEVIETREQFAVRRVEWATECFRKQNISPAWSGLILLAGVYELREIPQVKEAIDAALQSLESLSIVDRCQRKPVHQSDNNSTQ